MALPPSQAALYMPVQPQLLKQAQTLRDRADVPPKRLTVFWHWISVDRSSMLHNILFFTSGWHLQEAVELCRGSQECTTRGRTSRETLQPVSIRLFLICRTHKYFLFAADETPALVLSISHFLAAGVLFQLPSLSMEWLCHVQTPLSCSCLMLTPQSCCYTWIWWPSTPRDLSGASGVLLLAGVSAAQPREQHPITNPTVTMGTPQRLGPHQAQAEPLTPLQTLSAATGELLTDTILNVPLLSPISLEKGLEMLFTDQTSPLIFSNLSGICDNT